MKSILFEPLIKKKECLGSKEGWRIEKTLTNRKKAWVRKNADALDEVDVVATADEGEESSSPKGRLANGKRRMELVGLS